MANGKPDYYDILGVSKTASADELKKAYRKQAFEWHPDRHKDNKEAAEKRFKEINEAYQILSDSSKRQAYDQFGHQAQGNPFTGGGQSPFTYSYSSSNGQNPFGNMDFGDPFEIFEQFFGGGNSPFGRKQSIPRYSLSIEFMEAAKGVEKTVKIEGKTRKLKIPAGVDDGTRINFEDFILSINVLPHKTFERDGADVYITISIPYSLAVLGSEIKVPTVDGEVKVKIRAGTQAGSMIRLRGMGIKHLRGQGRGDQYVRLTILVPEKLSREQKRVIQELQKEKL